ncbi:hypothetical protein OE749_11670 [Aestuariibacter sp. AA17]|uniref:Uncharacterized protein n=1 Tax=Fluctibacter corallii TaxID=2984329 RepID=A0ABT3AAN4_9ALTE|nr:hypothetical protein [Aestuariibacter sp. AA17]MCV2885352.1 hypothetical protein [Aestuariibacter sp. AA17]
MSKLDKDQVIAKFTEAYKAANGKAPSIEAKGGWYSVDGGKNLRLAALDELADEMSKGKGKAATKESKPATKSSPAKPKAKKPVTKKKAKGGFSVKEYWAEKIQAENTGARKPR